MKKGEGMCYCRGAGLLWNTYVLINDVMDLDFAHLLLSGLNYFLVFLLFT